MFVFITKQNIAQLVLLSALCVFAATPAANAYEITNVNVENSGDFVLEPAKVEMTLNPEASETRELVITNRTGDTLEFTVSIEDFKGSPNPNKTIVLLEDKTGPYSLKDFIEPEIREFTLRPKERITLPVTVTAPFDAEPGGLYGSVLISGRTPDSVSAGGAAGAKVISRLGALFFVRIPGDANEDGQLEDFRITGGKSVYFEQGPKAFEVLYRNDGNVHLNPYGIIQIKNIGGVVVDELEVEPYFALPDSLRFRKVDWNKEILFGYYTATLKLNRGYEDIIDEQTIRFVVVPWKILFGVLAGIALIVLIVKWFTSRFEFRKKESTEETLNDTM